MDPSRVFSVLWDLVRESYLHILLYKCRHRPFMQRIGHFNFPFDTLFFGAIFAKVPTFTTEMALLVVHVFLCFILCGALFLFIPRQSIALWPCLIQNVKFPFHFFHTLFIPILISHLITLILFIVIAILVAWFIATKCVCNIIWGTFDMGLFTSLSRQVPFPVISYICLNIS